MSMFVWGDDKALPRGTGNLADQSAKGKVTIYIVLFLYSFDSSGAYRFIQTG